MAQEPKPILRYAPSQRTSQFPLGVFVFNCLAAGLMGAVHVAMSWRPELLHAAGCIVPVAAVILAIWSCALTLQTTEMTAPDWIRRWNLALMAAYWLGFLIAGIRVVLSVLG